VFSMSIPDADDAAIYRQCIRHRTAQTQPLLSALTQDINSAYGAYRDARGNPHLLPPLAFPKPSEEALRDNFALLNAGRPLSQIRDTLMRRSGAGQREDMDNQKCPMCGRVNIASLDHYLPKSLYPEFAVFSMNLVPVCSECNRLKGNDCGDAAGGRFLHAYFDVLPQQPVLFARITVTKKRVAVIFELRKPSSMDTDLFRSLQFHFKRLRLALHFRRDAMDELGDRREAFATWFELAKAQGVARYLRIDADSAEKQRGVHYWRTALLRGVQHSGPFCDGGFARL
jgi:hypothetical protein